MIVCKIILRDVKFYYTYLILPKFEIRKSDPLTGIYQIRMKDTPHPHCKNSNIFDDVLRFNLSSIY